MGHRKKRGDSSVNVKGVEFIHTAVEGAVEAVAGAAITGGLQAKNAGGVVKDRSGGSGTKKAEARNAEVLRNMKYCGIDADRHGA